MQQLTVMLFNKILIQREFPSAWKTAIIIPIRKENGEDFKEPRNYRPISLTKYLCKILEKIVKKFFIAKKKHSNSDSCGI